MTNNDAPFIDTSVNIIAWLTIYGYCCLTKLNLHQNYFIITVKIKIVVVTSETKEIIKIMKHQITAYFFVLYTSASINHFFIWASKWLFKTLYVRTKIRNRWNNSMKITSCTEGPIEITIIICDCLILRLYEINGGFSFKFIQGVNM